MLAAVDPPRGMLPPALIILPTANLPMTIRLARIGWRSRPGVLASLALSMFALTTVGCDLTSLLDPEDPPEPLRIDTHGAPIYGAWVVGVNGTTIGTESVDGKLGNVSVKAARLNDTTMVVSVPEVEPGMHELTFQVGELRFAGTVEALAAIVVPEPAVYVQSAVDQLVESLDAQQAMLLEDTTSVSGADRAQYEADLQEIRAFLAEAEQEFLAASPSDQAAIASYLAGNAPSLGFQASQGSSVLSLVTSPSYLGNCRGAPDYWECAFEVIEVIGYAAGGYLAVVAVAEVGAWFLTPAGKIAAKLGAAAGAGVLLGGAAITIHKYLIEESFPKVQAPNGTLAFWSAEERAVTIQAEYHSITTADLAKYPAAARVAAALNSLAKTWDGLVRLIPFFNRPAPTIPAQPLRQTVKDVPARELSIGVTTPSSVVGSSRVYDREWLLTFEQLGQVMTEIPFVFEVLHRPTGLPNSTTRAYGSLTLRPDSTEIYEDALEGTFWSVKTTGQLVPYTLEILGGGTGIYHAEDGPGTMGGEYRMSWSIIERDGRYHFVDSGFWNGWSPTSALTYPPTSFSATAACCPDSVVSYTRQ